MGLFMQRPEEPTEWAGIPSDPDRAESAAERLVEAAPIDAGSSFFFDGGAIESILIPAAPIVEVVEVQESGEDV